MIVSSIQSGTRIEECANHCVAEPVDHYLSSFSWNKVKYRAEKPISELIDILQKVSEEEPLFA